MVHLGIIPDGNRRWCENNNIKHTCLVNHRINKMVKTLIEYISNIPTDNSDFNNNILKITELSVYLLSIDNMKRNDETIKMGYEFIESADIIFSNILLKNISSEEKKLKKIISNIKINIIGDVDKIPKNILDILKKYNSQNKNAFIINLAIAYDYMKDIKGEYKRKQSNIDVLFRSGCEKRLSGFFPTKTMYSELFFSDKLWPDITLFDINTCISQFYKRERRYGK